MEAGRNKTLVAVLKYLDIWLYLFEHKWEEQVEQESAGIFLPFWSLGQGLVELGKKHLDHKNWENLMQSKRTGPSF